MKKRARICFYIFIACAFFALGILGYFVFNPSNDNVMVGSKKFVTFNEVPNASVYAVRVKDKNDNYLEGKTYYKIVKSPTENKNTFKFNTQVEINDIKVAEESYEQEILSERNEKIDCIIKNYEVTFFDEFGEVEEKILFEDQTLRDVSKKTLCCVVSEYFDAIFIKDGIYKIELSALDEEGNQIENSTIEINYEYEAYYIRDFVRRPSFFMNGFEIDYVIDDKKEFEEFVWHSILYRENNITFYCNASDINEGNINYLTVEAINNYPEYDGLYDVNTYATLNNNVGKLFNFYYYLDFNFTKSFKDLREKDENSYNLALEELHSKNENFNISYVKNGEDDLERTFPIDSVEKEVLVYNTEQLFMAVQYGAKPVFVGEDDENYKDDYAVARTVYSNAREELKKINNSNELSDYLKALNIYRYLCENVVYDYVTYEYMNIKQDFSVYTFGSFNCFYLEGVFLDLENQYAVCDGLAKAYVLMCRIEGIPCVKVNGKVGFGRYDDVKRDGESHAWNKVGLIDSADENKTKWLYVDATWGVGTDNENKKEYLTHSYYLFMPSDKLNNETRVVEFASEIDVSNGNEDNENPIEVSYDYYAKTYYRYTDESEVEHYNNCLIESDAELSDILGFVKNRIKTKKENEEPINYVLEIEFNSIYADFNFGGMHSKIYELLHPSQNFDVKEWLSDFGFDEDINTEWFKVTNKKTIVLFRFFEEEPIEEVVD